VIDLLQRAVVGVPGMELLWQVGPVVLPVHLGRRFEEVSSKVCIKMAYSLEQKISKRKLIEFCETNHIRKLSIFGSAIREQLGPDSDIDLLVEFEEGCTPGLFSIVRMEMELGAVLGRKVDLRTPQDLSQYFRDEVVRSARLQYQS